MGCNFQHWKMLCISTKPRLLNRHNVLTSRRICTSLLNLASEKAKEAPTNDILNDLRAPELNDEEIRKKQFKARIPERVYRQFVLKEALPIETKFELQMYRLRKHYAKFGQVTKLNPGICWPTRKELQETLDYNEQFEPSLQERIQNVESKRLAEEERRREVEAEVDKNMAKLDKSMAEYYGKIEQKEAKAKEMKLEREKLVEEIGEYLGYDIDPKDPRFKEAVEQKNKEKKKALKVKKQQESYNKMLDKLKKIAQNK